ncbi:ATP-dependent DNA helicase UvrD2 [soil metagenome]
MLDAATLLEGLDPEQRAVATALHGPVCVLAGAGTGKTRAITSRIGYGVATGTYAPSEVLALTFTTRAAGELRERLRALGAAGVQARTFHSAALRQARYFWPSVFGRQLPDLVVSKVPLLAEAVRRCRVDASAALLRDLAAEVEWAKVTNVRPDDYAGVASRAGRDGVGLDEATVARVFAAYEEVKRERVRIDMEDVLLCAAALLEEDAAAAAQIRRQYRWLVVDEFQDVSPIQSVLLDLWLGGRDGLCVVGDPMQTIYSFAGASPSYLTDFHRRFPAAQRITLVRNYRSTPQVIEVANAVGRAAAGARGRSPVVLLQSQSPAGDPVRFAGHANEVDEAAWVASQIATLRTAGLPLPEVAVLLRINAASETFEEALAARQIPYVMRGAERFFDRPEVKQAVMLLRGAVRGGDADTGDLVANAQAVLTAMGWALEPPGGRGVQRARWESLHALVTVAAELVSGSPGGPDTPGLAQLVEELERRAELQHSPVADGVTVATLHSAKGLEWDAVFLGGMHEGSMPIVHASTTAAVEEERRLFYVGVTRARSALTISWSAARTPGSRGNRRPTRFLNGIRPADETIDAAPAVRGGARGGRRSRTVARCRGCDRPLATASERKIGRCEACPTDYDERLFERLRDWRSAQAQEQKFPAYCVFTDATLVAIAETRPTDDRALGAIAGIGRSKLDRYGADVLALCADALDDDTQPVSG